MTTAHNHQVVFGRRVSGCPRCAELTAGAKPVQGWGALKRRFEKQASAATAAHDCHVSKCGPVCTFGDW